MTGATEAVSRRRFLRESVAWSAFAAMPALRSVAAKPPDPRAAHALVIGDWGWSEKLGAETARNGNGFEAQKMVARGMERYARSSGIHADGLFMLGDSWYGELTGGATSPRWLEQFERLYPLETFGHQRPRFVGPEGWPNARRLWPGRWRTCVIPLLHRRRQIEPSRT